jgi:hypothetical protein
VPLFFLRWSEMRKRLMWFGCLLFGFSSLGFAAQRDDLGLYAFEAPRVRKAWGLSPGFDGVKNFEKTRVAVLDVGFHGAQSGGQALVNGDSVEGKWFLPKTTELIESYPGGSGKPLIPGEVRGLHVANIVWGMVGYPENGPQFHLYNAHGAENFIAGMQSAIQWKADIILASLDAEALEDVESADRVYAAIQAAVKEGAIVITSAGDLAGKVYQGPVTLQEIPGGASFVTFGGPSKFYLHFVNRIDDNDVTVKASWVRRIKGKGVVVENADLDLQVMLQSDPAKPPLLKGVSQNVQAKGAIVSQEKVRLSGLKANRGNEHYVIAMLAKPGSGAEKQFNPETDRLRITIRSAKPPKFDRKLLKSVEAVAMVEATPYGDLELPADGAGLTVGDFAETSSKGPTLDGRGKPEFLAEFYDARFSDHRGGEGTAYASAWLAGAATLLRTAEPGLRQAHLLKFRKKFPTIHWERSGWRKDNPMAAISSVGSKELLPYFSGRYTEDKLYWRFTDSDQVTIGITDDFLTQYSVDAEVKARPADYNFWVYVFKEPTTKSVKDPDRFVKDPDREVKTTEGTYVNTAAPAGMAMDAYGNLYYAFALGTQYVPPQYKTVPGETRRVPGETRQVPGEPNIYYLLDHARKDSGKKQTGPGFVKLEHLMAPDVLGGQPVSDGSAGDPRVFDPPKTVEALQKAVNGTR